MRERSSGRQTLEATSLEDRRRGRPLGESAAGFTLMELLVSITVVSLLATGILFGWRVASAAWQKAGLHLEKQRKAQATHQLLQEQMASMVPYAARTSQGTLEVFFQGEPQAARFVSRYSLVHRARAGLYRVEYQVAAEANGAYQLLLNETPVAGPEELSALVIGVSDVVSRDVARS